MNSLKSNSFSFKRNVPATSSTVSATSKCSETSNCRRKLQYKCDDQDEEKTEERGVLSVLNLNNIDTRKVLRTGAEKLTKTFNSVRTSIGTFSQKFKISTKRRQILEEGPMTPNPHLQTPHTAARQVLGRTPTKLYSPFGIDSPYQPTTYSTDNLPKRQVCHIRD